MQSGVVIRVGGHTGGHGTGGHGTGGHGPGGHGTEQPELSSSESECPL